MSYLSAILAAFVILSCPPGTFLNGLTYYEQSPLGSKVYFGGNEYIEGLPVGSILYIFDDKTNFLGLRFQIEFPQDLQEPSIVERHIQSGPCFWEVKGTEKEAARYFESVRSYFFKHFVTPPAIDYVDNVSASTIWILYGYETSVMLRRIDGIVTLEVGVTKRT